MSKCIKTGLKQAIEYAKRVHGVEHKITEEELINGLDEHNCHANLLPSSLLGSELDATEYLKTSPKNEGVNKTVKQSFQILPVQSIL